MGTNSIKKFEEEVLFTKDDIEYIKSFFNGWEIASVYNGNESSQDFNFRKCFTSYKSKDKKLINFLVKKLNSFGVKSISDGIQLLKYKEGHYFRAHRDNSTDKFRWRFKSLVTQLSKSSEYEGGELLIKGRPIKKQLGNTVMFDSNNSHEVLELTKGTRYTMVAWLTKDDII